MIKNKFGRRENLNERVNDTRIEFRDGERLFPNQIHQSKIVDKKIWNIVIVSVCMWSELAKKKTLSEHKWYSEIDRNKRERNGWNDCVWQK